jgi:hypothetical protein
LNIFEEAERKEVDEVFIFPPLSYLFLARIEATNQPYDLSVFASYGPLPNGNAPFLASFASFELLDDVLNDSDLDPFLRGDARYLISEILHPSEYVLGLWLHARKEFHAVVRDEQFEDTGVVLSGMNDPHGEYLYARIDSRSYRKYRMCGAKG